MPEGRKKILLVHGAWHGAWCWERVERELEAMGHDVDALDLPGHGERAGERAEGLEQYRDAVLDVLEPGTVLVGHSMGGAVITMVADAAPERIERLVYVAAFLPEHGRSIMDTASAAGDVDLAAVGLELDELARVAVPPIEGAIAIFYADCDPEDAAWAHRRLVPEPVASLVEPVSVPRFTGSGVPSTYVLCAQDAAVDPDLQRSFAARLGVDPVVLDTAHSPFLNRPADVARAIVDGAAAPV